MNRCLFSAFIDELNKLASAYLRMERRDLSREADPDYRDKEDKKDGGPPDSWRRRFAETMRRRRLRY